MKYAKIIWDDLGVTAEIGRFAPETHVILHVEPRAELFEGQMRRIVAAEERLATAIGADARQVTKRYFLSDSTNQVPVMMALAADAKTTEASTNFIQQPPLDGSKIATWLYLIDDADISTEEGMTIVKRGPYRHLWKMGMSLPQGTSYEQTERLLQDYETALATFDASIADNCIRTWFYVRDVDTQYAGMVKARLANFIEQGLTSDTHYLASTGIQGLPAETQAIIQLGTYAVTGLAPTQQHYLYALDHLNPTIEYGVTFERGTVVEYGDRSHALISGTASIDAKGQVVHIGDIVRQTERMWENVEALLAEGGMTMGDCAQIIVYLRDVSDYRTVRKMFEERYPDIPTVFTLAPVCRPTWLIEMECIAIATHTNTAYSDF